jgi:hypothetical protein
VQELKCLSIPLFDDGALAEIVVHLKNLSRLWLPKQASVQTFEALSTLKHLYELNVEGSKDTFPLQLQYLQQLTTLTSLQVEYPVINNEIFSFISSITSLKSLSLCKTNPSKSTERYPLNELTKLNTLYQLKLKYLELVDTDLEILLKFSFLTSLEIVNAKHLTLDGILQLTQLTTLDKLIVSNNYQIEPNTTLNKYFPPFMDMLCITVEK